MTGQAEIRFDEPMARHSTLRIGGPVDAWVAPRSIEALRALRAVASRLGVSARAFGAGSNLLVRDGGIRGLAVSLKYLGRVALLAGDREHTEGANVLVDAGAATGRVL